MAVVSLNNEVQCIMGGGHIGVPSPSDRQIRLKTLPSLNYVGRLYEPYHKISFDSLRTFVLPVQWVCHVH